MNTKRMRELLSEIENVVRLTGEHSERNPVHEAVVLLLKHTLKTRTVRRSAKHGRFVSKQYAESNPDHTVEETR